MASPPELKVMTLSNPARASCGFIDHVVLEGGEEGHAPSRAVIQSPEPGGMPLALMVEAATGDLRKSMNACAAPGSFASSAIAAGKISSCCTSAGNGPTI